MTVGEVARRSGVTRKALRLYEARGILPPPRRTAAGYRIYAPDVLDALDFVQQGRRLGLTLAEIKHIISLRRSGAALGRGSPNPNSVAADERTPRRDLPPHRTQRR